MDSRTRARARAVVVAFALLAVCSSQALADGPKAVVEETEYTAKPVREGLAVMHEFIVSNKGDEELMILKVKPS